MASKYFQRVGIRRQSQDTGSDVSSGLAAGLAAGKLIGQLAGAYQGMQKEAIANRLMNTEDAPRAALVSPGGHMVTGTGGPEPAAGNTVDPDADLSTDLPEDVSTAVPRVQVPGAPMTPGPSGAQQPVPATIYGGTNTDPLASSVAAAKLSQKFVPNVIPAGVSTAGTAPHRGGTDEMQLQKEILNLRLQKAQGARADAEEADREAERQGTGRFALDAATKRLQLAKLQAEIRKANAPEKEDKNAPPENVNEEPVRDLSQLGDYVDNQYGNGAYNGLVKAVSAASSGPDLAKDVPDTNPDGTPRLDEHGAQVMKKADSVEIPLAEADPLTGKGGKSIKLPLKDVQAYVRQTNLQRLAQGLPPLRVPGEDQSLGATRDKPFVAHSKIEVLSRAPGTWVLPPGGTVPVQAWTAPNGQLIRPVIPKKVKRQF